MKGIIFNLLEQVISLEHGEEVWDELLDETGITGAYTAVGTYPHEQLVSLVEAASRRLGASPWDVERWFGRASFPLLAERYPGFFEGHRSARSFILTLNDVIHPEVRKLFPGAYAPSFEFDTAEAGALSLSYTSQRNLCAFAEGLVEGAADHFGEHAVIEQTACARRGDDRCVLHVKFERA